MSNDTFQGPVVLGRGRGDHEQKLPQLKYINLVVDVDLRSS